MREWFFNHKWVCLMNGLLGGRWAQKPLTNFDGEGLLTCNKRITWFAINPLREWGSLDHKWVYFMNVFVGWEMGAKPIRWRSMASPLTGPENFQRRSSDHTCQVWIIWPKETPGNIKGWRGRDNKEKKREMQSKHFLTSLDVHVSLLGGNATFEPHLMAMDFSAYWPLTVKEERLNSKRLQNQTNSQCAFHEWKIRSSILTCWIELDHASMIFVLFSRSKCHAVCYCIRNNFCCFPDD